MSLRILIYNAIYLWYRVINTPSIIRNKVSVGNKVHFRGCVFFKTVGRNKKSSIVIGNNVNINSSLSADPIGGDTRTILYTRHDGVIKIGDGVGLSNTTIVAESFVVIGEYTNIGGSTKIYDTDFHSIDSRVRLNGDKDIKSSPVTIGERVFIGGHCLILKGVTIGNDSVIGAGSVVTKDVPSGEIWAGNPARFIRKIYKNED